MKANELMIGDWVQPCSRSYPVQVETLSADTINGDMGAAFDPVPITPEILEKNGWRHKYYGIYRQTIGETITIDVYPEGCSVEDERGSQCRYRLRYHLPALKFVHELQHALLLCGIDKEIEL